MKSTQSRLDEIEKLAEIGQRAVDKYTLQLKIIRSNDNNQIISELNKEVDSMDLQMCLAIDRFKSFTASQPEKGEAK